MITYGSFVFGKHLPPGPYVAWNYNPDMAGNYSIFAGPNSHTACCCVDVHGDPTREELEHAKQLLIGLLEVRGQQRINQGEIT